MSAAPRPEALQRPAFQGRTRRGGAEWALPGEEAGLRGGRVPKGRDRGGGSPTTIHSPARGRPRGRPALSSTNEALYLQGVHPSLARRRRRLQQVAEAAPGSGGGGRARRVLSGPGQARSKGTRPWAPGPRAEVCLPGEGGTQSAPWGQAGVRTTAALLIGWRGLCGEREREVRIGPVVPPAPGPSSPLTIGVAPRAVFRGLDQGTGGGHRPSRTLCKVGHGGTCRDAQGRGQRVGSGASILRSRFRGTRHGAQGSRWWQLL